MERVPALSSAIGDAIRRASRELPRPPESSAASPESAELAIPNKRLLAANTDKRTSFLGFFVAKRIDFSARRLFIMKGFLQVRRLEGSMIARPRT